jgi:hypothetical protein
VRFSVPPVFFSRRTLSPITSQWQKYQTQCYPSGSFHDLKSVGPPRARPEFEEDVVRKKAQVKKPGRVQKIIKSPVTNEPEKAEISVEDADHLYREIRIENTLHDEQGQKVRLKEGADVEVVIEADSKAVTPKDEESDKPAA